VLVMHVVLPSLAVLPLSVLRISYTMFMLYAEVG